MLRDYWDNSPDAQPATSTLTPACRMLHIPWKLCWAPGQTRSKISQAMVAPCSCAGSTGDQCPVFKRMEESAGLLKAFQNKGWTPRGREAAGGTAAAWECSQLDMSDLSPP